MPKLARQLAVVGGVSRSARTCPPIVGSGCTEIAGARTGDGAIAANASVLTAAATSVRNRRRTCMCAPLTGREPAACVERASPLAPSDPSSCVQPIDARGGRQIAAGILRPLDDVALHG